MDEPDELERIRAAKRERLREQAQTQGGGDADTTDAATPVSVDTPEHFTSLLSSHQVVLADFYADWCGPCQMLAPILETIAADTQATVVKIDTEAHPKLAQRHGVRGLPTLVLFVGGEPAERLVGLQTEDALRTVVARHAGGN
ncbi:thioredoxin [Natronobiforma cellulositropha]|uniref:thioredoxin n=1 Tax=Natronobiforma cellulositropha TaxID=1679076 RepID=UPI0021D589F3|nr:thioredoxin [Natronobiforma cellulositropha]